MKNLTNGVILSSLTAFTIAAAVVVFACSKPKEEVSEDAIKTEKRANMECDKIQMPLECCFEVCVDCDKDFKDLINTNTHGRPAMEWSIRDCRGNPFTIHFEYFGQTPGSDKELRNPANWLWARDQTGKNFCSCAKRILCADDPDDIKDAWFAAICSLCKGKFCP